MGAVQLVTPNFTNHKSKYVESAKILTRRSRAIISRRKRVSKPLALRANARNLPNTLPLQPHGCVSFAKDSLLSINVPFVENVLECANCASRRAIASRNADNAPERNAMIVDSSWVARNLGFNPKTFPAPASTFSYKAAAQSKSVED